MTVHISCLFDFHFTVSHSTHSTKPNVCLEVCVRLVSSRRTFLLIPVFWKRCVKDFVCVNCLNVWYPGALNPSPVFEHRRDPNFQMLSGLSHFDLNFFRMCLSLNSEPSAKIWLNGTFCCRTLSAWSTVAPFRPVFPSFLLNELKLYLLYVVHSVLKMIWCCQMSTFTHCAVSIKNNEQ